MPIVRRFFRQAQHANNPSSWKAFPLENYADKNVVVVLGEPGIGKTTEFETSAKREPNAVTCTVSQFLHDPIDEYTGKTIFLDALDERRAEFQAGTSVIDAICGRLKSLERPKVRISCRNEEWHGRSDVRALESVSGNEPIHVLTMLPLSEVDIRTIAAEEVDDVGAFLEGAHDRQLIELFGNPETLKLYIRVYNADGGWPESRVELMDRSVDLLIREENEQHERVQGDKFSNEQLTSAVEDLSAILLFSEKDELALSRANAKGNSVPLQDLPRIDLAAARVAARRRVFSSSALGLVHAQHKTTGDYLAARALVRRIRNKSLPFSRALTLLVGRDGSPLSHLRDTYAWLVTLLPEFAEQLVERDPFGALIYGDLGEWPIENCRFALSCLREYAAESDPWFRSQAWHAPSLGALSQAGLIEEFHSILNHENVPHLTSVILSALLFGKPLPDLGDDLITFARDPGRPGHDWLRVNAVRAFARNCPGRKPELVTVLDEILSGGLADDEQRLQVALLDELYPDEIEVGDIVHYMTIYREPGQASCLLMGTEIVKRTATANLGELLGAIRSHPEATKRVDRIDRMQMSGALMRRLLSADAATITPELIFEAQEIYLSKSKIVYLDDEDLEPIKTAIENTENLYMGVFRCWLDQSIPDKEYGFSHHFVDFQNRMLDARPPKNYAETLLKWAETERDSAKANFLFDEAARIIIDCAPGASHLGLSDLIDYVEQHPEFSETLTKNCVFEISEHYWERVKNTLRSKKKKKEKRRVKIESLTPKLSDLQAGTDHYNLWCGANSWFGYNSGGGKKDSPIMRVQSATNDEIANAMVEGFVSLLCSDDPRAPREIAELNCQKRSQQYYTSSPTLAGADILFARDPTGFLELPEANLKAALAYHLINSFGAEVREWDKAIVNKFPGVYSEVLAEVWRTELKAGKGQHLDGMYIGQTEDIVTPLILNELYILLSKQLVLPPSILDDMLKSVLFHGDAENLRSVYPTALADKKVYGTVRILWLSIAALMEPDKFRRLLENSVRKKSRYLWTAHEILCAGAGVLMNGYQTVPQLQMSISILGKYVNNVPFSSSERTLHAQSQSDAARNIRELIATLSNIATVEAGEAFDALLEESALHQWRDTLHHNRTVQAGNLRDAMFEYPTVENVCNTLACDAPASMADFRAFALDVLKDISAQVRGSNANLWKSFWRLASHGTLEAPKTENDSRDAMLPWIEPYLNSRGITIEPEASAADQKRVDIRMTKAVIGTLPIEVKRDDNDELWTAMDEQLLARYANDPATQGFGIYLVIWHGENGNGCKTPPQDLDIPAPKDACELRMALEKIKPSDQFAVHVVDASKPHRQGPRVQN